MKAIRLFVAALWGMLLVSCGKETPEKPLVPEESDYVGTVTVIYQEAPFDNENISVNFTPSEDGQTASITLHQIRFVPQMPVTIDVTIPDIRLQSTTEKIILSCERTIPWALGGNIPGTRSRACRVKSSGRNWHSRSISAIIPLLSKGRASSSSSAHPLAVF